MVTYTIRVHIVNTTKHLEPNAMGSTEAKGNEYSVWVRNNPEYGATMAHELGHIIEDIAQELDFHDESLPELLEDAVRNFMRAKNSPNSNKEVAQIVRRNLLER